MKLNTSKFNLEIPNWLLVVGALIADNMYSNHCKKKALNTVVENMVNEPKKAEEESH